MQKHSSSRLYSLDLLRFVAAFGVVLYHYISRENSNAFPLLSEITKFGYLGVPLFFIISGFVIALSASNRSAIEFAISRFVRLYPALWICVIFTIAIASFIADKSYSIAQVLANFTLLNEYFGQPDVDGVYWTLKAELKFYACIFLLILFRFYEHHRIWVTTWMLSTVIYLFIEQPFFMGWFITPHYSSFFIAGIALYLIHQRKDVAYAYQILFISLLVSMYKATDQIEGFIRNPQPMDSVIAAASIFLFFSIMLALATGILHLKKVSWIATLGAITYPLYLTHNVAGKAIIDKFSENPADERLLIPLTIMFMLGTSYAIHRYIERPVSSPLKQHLLQLLNYKIQPKAA